MTNLHGPKIVTQSLMAPARRGDTPIAIFSFHRIADNPPSAPQTLVTPLRRCLPAFVTVLCALRSHATLRLNSVSPQVLPLLRPQLSRAAALLGPLGCLDLRCPPGRILRWRVAPAASRRRALPSPYFRHDRLPPRPVFHPGLRWTVRLQSVPVPIRVPAGPDGLRRRGLVLEPASRGTPGRRRRIVL